MIFGHVQTVVTFSHRLSSLKHMEASAEPTGEVAESPQLNANLSWVRLWGTSSEGFGSLRSSQERRVI